MRRPRATFWRKGRISSGFVGPPKAINSTASTVTVTRAASPPRAEGGERWVRPGSVRSSLGTHVMDHVDQRLHVIDRRGGQDAVAEVEDVAGTAGGAAQDVGDPLADVRGLRHQHDRIEVALHGDV